MKQILTLLLFATVVFMQSCKKETDAQLLSGKLQNIIKTQNIERVITSNGEIGDPSNAFIFGDWGTHFRFDPPLVIIEDKTYNLLTMKSYQLVTISNYKCMVLVF